ncbi:AI-2E family transporter [Acuticoccus sediminis]|uniref:AI-2E family transporter n=1 Tax=Acuticoccus sediminis TaxID=2184697 RepID=A0A8B2NMN7_9HYPH|nr:AI-2E family transporter [Acuticoccus sediminis]RAH96743.1 AI-2E family transporter [Acuticoccus sediminis]
MTTSRPAPVRPEPVHVRPNWALVGIFIILAFGAVALARSFLMPMTLALLLFFVFALPCRILARAGIPPSISAGIITLALFFGLIGGIMSLAVPIASAVDDAPRIFGALQDKLASLEGSVDKIRDAMKQVETMAVPEEGGGEATKVVTTGTGLGVLTGIATTTPALLGQIVFTLVLLFFALASRDLLYRRTVESFSRFRDKRAARAAIDEIEKSLGIYLGSITLINAILGLAIGLAMWAWGMPAPELFGVAGFALNYVPYVGPVSGIIMATLVALVTLDGVLQPILVGMTILGLISLEGQFITPYFLSRRLSLNPVVVFVAVALFAWLWSAIGMVVAVPMLVVLNVMCAHIPGMQGLGNFLSGSEETCAGEEDAPKGGDTPAAA